MILVFCITYNTLFVTKKNNQIHCKPGYYIPSDNLWNKQCIKCSIEYCKKCYGNSNSNICTSCFSSFILRYDNSHKISFCQKEDNKEEDNKNNRTTNITNKDSSFPINININKEKNKETNHIFIASYYSYQSHPLVKLINCSSL